MTAKQFNWFKNHQPFHVLYFELYECKKHKEYYPMSRVKAEFNGECFLFSGVYHIFKGHCVEERAIMYKVHHKNVRKLKYRIKK